MDPIKKGGRARVGKRYVRSAGRLRWLERAVPGCAALALAAGILSGCASPAPPRPPSLRLPAVVRNLSADRAGDVVTLRFTVPQRTTDNLPVRERALGLRVCRELEHAPCDPVAGLTSTVAVAADPSAGPRIVELTDTLRGQFAQGPPRLMGYRVEIANARGRSAGFSEPVWVAAGTAPAPVVGFQVRGSRLGAVISWQPEPQDGGRILVERDDVTAAPKPGGPHATTAGAQVLLRPDPAAPAGNTEMLDTGAAEQMPFRYSAFRERVVHLDGHTLTQRSESTAPVAFTLEDTFPPPAPTDLTAAAFFGSVAETAPPSPPDVTQPPPDGGVIQPGAFAVDLIWEPVEDPGLAGYNVYRQTLSTAGEDQGARVRLNSSPVPLPSFHDTTAAAGTRYRWSVTALDRRGNESASATAELNPEATVPVAPPAPPVRRRRPHGR